MNYTQKSDNADIYSKMCNTVLRIKQRFHDFCKRVPVLGFNSSKYDLNLIKKTFAKNLQMDENRKTFTMKRINVYNVFSNESLQFLDITNFLAPGTSYAAFLKAYGIREKKGFLPYEWFDDLKKLNCLCLPHFGDACTPICSSSSKSLLYVTFRHKRSLSDIIIR